MARRETYDDAGALTSRADGWTYRYDARQRLSSISYAGILRQTNQYNAKGERVLRTSGSGMSSTTHYFVHDEEGHLIAEYQKIGLALPALQKQYLWLDGRPVAIKVNSGAYSGELLHVHSDHLGSPRAVTRPAEQDAVVWRWDVQESAFGENDPNEDPDGNGPPLSLNLRFPGQYADSVTRTHYNYFRDYEPGTGRYVESDPIGLKGGLSTYGYVFATPLLFVDPTGLSGVGRRFYSNSPGQRGQHAPEPKPIERPEDGLDPRKHQDDYGLPEFDPPAGPPPRVQLCRQLGLMDLNIVGPSCLYKSGCVQWECCSGNSLTCDLDGNDGCFRYPAGTPSMFASDWDPARDRRCRCLIKFIDSY